MTPLALYGSQAGLSSGLREHGRETVSSERQRVVVSPIRGTPHGPRLRSGFVTL